MSVSLPPAALVLGAVLGAAELVLFIWALVDLIRRPRTSLLPRWAWLVIIIVLELLGPIFYLALGRGEPAVTDTAAPGGGVIASASELGDDRTRRAVDTLYGPSPEARPPGGAHPQDPPQRPAGHGTAGGA